MNISDIEKLVDLVSCSGVAEVTLESETRRITVRKGIGRPASAVIEALSDAPMIGESDLAEYADEIPGNAYPLATIIAPMVGIFHNAEQAVEAGSKVEIGHVVGIIESMKLMNDIRAEQAGIVREVHVEPGVAVEYGQPLFELEAD
jgi:acetyl-CoA carboxylase biotin carboxyl carrier protein